ncbi:MAG: hypothetical protein AB1512_02445 [Thermodesulfobacteriota bacterium]
MRTNAEFFEVVGKHMGAIQMLYHKFADKKPVMVITLPDSRIYAYPYSGYLKTLSARSQKMLWKEYRAANKKNEMVVFVRDEETRVLKSGSFPIEEIIETT